MADQKSGFDPAAHITDLRGKQYLEVKWRLAWLRDRHPEAIIITELVEHSGTFALFKADVTIPYNGTDMTGGGSATGYGSETVDDFGDFIEKAETKALGRALAALGYGTQFCGDELDEMGGKRGQRIVDSPVQQKARPAAQSSTANGRRPSTTTQQRAVRVILNQMFTRDEQAQVGCIASINAKAVNEAQTEIYLSPLSMDEASALIKELQAMQRAEGDREPTQP